VENPLTWTPLHHEINKVTLNHAEEILKILHSHNYKVTIDQVLRVVNRHKEMMQLRMCGLSLAAMIVNDLAKD